MSNYEVLEKKEVEKPYVKGDLILEQHAKRMSMSIRDMNPDSITIELNFEGQSKGKYEGRYYGTTNLVQKMDKTFEADTKIIETTRDGDIIVYSGKGHGKMINPDWTNWQVEVQFMTTSPKFSWLNGKKALSEGSTNIAKGEIQSKIYELR